MLGRPPYKGPLAHLRWLKGLQSRYQRKKSRPSGARAADSSGAGRLACQTGWSLRGWQRSRPGRGAGAGRRESNGGVRNRQGGGGRRSSGRGWGRNSGVIDNGGPSDRPVRSAQPAETAIPLSDRLGPAGWEAGGLPGAGNRLIRPGKAGGQRNSRRPDRPARTARCRLAGLLPVDAGFSGKICGQGLGQSGRIRQKEFRIGPYLDSRATFS